MSCCASRVIDMRQGQPEANLQQHALDEKIIHHVMYAQVYEYTQDTHQQHHTPASDALRPCAARRSLRQSQIAVTPNRPR